MTAITTQIKKISTAVPPLSWPELSPGCSTTAVAPMAMPIEPMPSTTAPNPIRPGTGSRRTRGARGGRRHLTEQPGVYPLVDFFADPLDEAFGYGGVVGRAEIAVRGRRGADFILDAHFLCPSSSAAAPLAAHAATLSAGRTENTGVSPRFLLLADPSKKRPRS